MRSIQASQSVRVVGLLLTALSAFAHFLLNADKLGNLIKRIKYRQVLDPPSRRRMQSGICLGRREAADPSIQAATDPEFRASLFDQPKSNGCYTKTGKHRPRKRGIKKHPSGAE